MADYSRDYCITYGKHESCRIDFRCFDTPNSITVYGPLTRTCSAEELLLAGRGYCLELHGLWSFTDARSDVSRLNAATDRVRVDERTASLVRGMKAFHEREALFDFTIGPASYAWKHAERVPDARQIAAALAHVGAERVRVDGSFVVKDDPCAQIDVGGAAKGFAADAVADLLRAKGVACADIDLGGNLFLLGQHPEGRPWRISVKIPDGVVHDPIILEVRDCAVVTSGSYERFVEIDGVRYQHIVDPATGWPVESDVVSATVVGPSALQADMLATTAVMVGASGLQALEARHPGYAFTCICESGTTP